MTVVTINKQQYLYVFILAASMMIMMVRPLLAASILDRVEFSKYSIGMLISSSFTMVGCFGLQLMLQRDMPSNIISGNLRKSVTALFSSIIISFIFLLFLIVACFSFMFTLSSLGTLGVIIALLNGFSQQVFILSTIESRSSGKYLVFSFQNLIRASFVFSAMFLVVSLTNSAIDAMLVEFITSLVVSYTIIYKLLIRYCLRIKSMFILSFRNILKLKWKTPLSLMSTVVLGYLLLNIDRWVAVKTLDAIIYSDYALAAIVLMAAQSVQSIINSSVFSSLVIRRKKRNSKECFTLAKTVSITLLVVGLLVCIPGYFIIKGFVLYFYPDYILSISIVPVFMAAGLFRASDIWSSYLIVIGEEKLLSIINVFIIFLSLLIWLFVVYFMGISLLIVSYLALLSSSLGYVTVMLVSSSISNRSATDLI